MSGWAVVLVVQVAFALGYICGRLSHVTSSVKDSPQGFFAQNSVAMPRAASPTTAAPATKIDIDDRKIVSQINTDTLQKVTQTELGTKTAVADDINASVNKLAQLRGRA